MGDSVTDFIAGVEAADEHRDIDDDFAYLREIMELLLHVITRLGRSLSKSPTSMCCATFIWVSGSKVCTGRTYMRFRRMPFAS